MSGLASIVYKITNWIMKLAYLNVLWISFTLAGIIILGLMPSTLSLFTIARKWIMGDTSIPIFKTFLETYKKEFVKINIIGFFQLILGGILFIDIYYFSHRTGLLSNIILYLFFIMGLLYLILVLYMFPTYVHFKFKLFQYFKYTLVLGLSNILGTLMILLLFIGISYLIGTFPAAFPFFGVSIMGYITMWIAHRGFSKLKDKFKSDANFNNVNA